MTTRPVLFEGPGVLIVTKHLAIEGCGLPANGPRGPAMRTRALVAKSPALEASSDRIGATGRAFAMTRREEIAGTRLPAKGRRALTSRTPGPPMTKPFVTSRTRGLEERDAVTRVDVDFENTTPHFCPISTCSEYGGHVTPRRKDSGRGTNARSPPMTLKRAHTKAGQWGSAGPGGLGTRLMEN